MTGSGEGVGRAIAKALAAEGAKVVTNNRKPGGNKFLNTSEAEYDSWTPSRRREFDAMFEKVGGDAETTAQQIRDAGGEAVACFGDISRFSFGEEIVQCALKNFGTVDILVNVAGGFGGGGVEEVSEELYDYNNNIKPKGYFNVIRAVVPIMREKRWGRIINCTSKAWQGDVVKFTQYVTCNAGVVGLTRGLPWNFISSASPSTRFRPTLKTGVPMSRRSRIPRSTGSPSPVCPPSRRSMRCRSLNATPRSSAACAPKGPAA